MSTSVSASIKERLRERIARDLEKDITDPITELEEESKLVETPAFMEDEPTDEPIPDNYMLFSEVVGFDPMAELGEPDFPMETFEVGYSGDEFITELQKDVISRKQENYVWNKQITYDFCRGIQHFHGQLVGKPGTGKTSLPEQICARTGQPMFLQSFGFDLEKDEWLMSKEITDKGTEWNVLPFVKAIQHACIVVLDEFNRLNGGGKLLLNRLTNKGGTLQLSDGSEVIPHAGWRAVATDNTRGLGDGLDKFEGGITDISTIDRFGFMLEVDYLPREDQVKLIQNWYPQCSTKIAEMIVDFGILVSKGYEAGKLPLPWTPRRMEKAVHFTLIYKNPVKGCQLSYYNYLPEDGQRQAVNQFLVDLGITNDYGEFK